MKAILTLDIGSTHGGTDAGMAMHIAECARRPQVLLKAQLFTGSYKGPNTVLPRDVYERAWRKSKDLGLRLYASVFDLENLLWLSRLDDSIVKLSYGMRKDLYQAAVDHYRHVVISIPYTEACVQYPDNVTRMLCIPEYPVMYDIRHDLIDWTMYDGFSSHLIGIDEDLKIISRASDMGMNEFLLEKHVRLNGKTSCPDATFAITWDDVDRLLQAIRCLA